MSAKLSLLNLHLRLLPSKVESFIDKTKKEFKDVVNREDCSEDDVPLDYDLIFNNPRVDLYSFDKETQNDIVNEPDSLNDNDDSKKQKRKRYMTVSRNVLYRRRRLTRIKPDQNINNIFSSCNVCQRKSRSRLL